MRMKQNDTIPTLTATLTDAVTGAAVNLTTATQIRVLGTRGGVLLFSRATTLPGSAVGVVTMPWQATDTTTAGAIAIVITVTWPGAIGPQTYPSEGVMWVFVEPSPTLVDGGAVTMTGTSTLTVK